MMNLMRKFLYLIVIIGLATQVTSCSKRGKKSGNIAPGAEMTFNNGAPISSYGLEVDEQGYLRDASGALILDANGNPVLSSDVTVDDQGRLIGPNGEILTDSLGNQLVPNNDLTPMGMRPEDMNIIASQFQAIYFGYDSNQVGASERNKAEEIANFLNTNPETGVIIEGHCDERGSREYNVALGERRALSVRNYLIGLGVDPGRIQTNSYGEEKPAAMGHDEGSWQANRRVEFVLFN